MPSGVDTSLIEIFGFNVLTTAEVVAILVHPFEPVKVNVYVPDMPVVAFVETVGDIVVLLKPLGPLHRYVFPAVPPVRVNVPPVQIGPLLLAVAIGCGFTVTPTSCDKSRVQDPLDAFTLMVKELVRADVVKVMLPPLPDTIGDTLTPVSLLNSW